MATPTLTPMMQQFRNIKAQYPDALLLFRCGDFYETYCEDAVEASKILNITLTHRSNKDAAATEMAGFPFHALETYLPKLVRAGKRVAICDQLEDPKMTKKLVKRGVTELVTPGVSYSDTTLQQKENNWVAALHFGKSAIGLAFLDISTGEFLAAEGNIDYVGRLLNNFAPKEVLFLRGKKPFFEQQFGSNFFTYELEDWMLSPTSAIERLQKQWGVNSLKGFGIASMENAIIAAGGILHYLDITQHHQTSHIQHIARIEEDRYVWLDAFTIRNLELTRSQHEGGKNLYDVLDDTRSPMGARMLHRWISFPLKEVTPIRNRQMVVRFFVDQAEAHATIREQIGLMQDMERIVSKIATRRISPREMLQLALALKAVARIKQIGQAASDNSFLTLLCEQLDPCSDIRARIEQEIAANPPAVQGRIGTIASGVDEELDTLRDIQTNSKDYLLRLQQHESEQTGIQSLKIGYNNVFGYYLEVRNTYRDLVPSTWIRKQTLVNAERYITPELKEYEEKILTAETQIQIIENRIYTALMDAMSQYVGQMQLNANIVAQLDCLQSFATVAKNNAYVCPDVNDSLAIHIEQGRHPVIEQQMQIGEKYIANDVTIDNQGQQIIIITGPNMAGKSALLRQTALIVLIAQIGAYVPAKSAQIGIVDKIFTRVGASDNISMGESTFMVEMNEASSILNNLSERSLVLFDELGRGTSTYDGISIAWAIVEYIHEHKAHAKTLFATHYHELNEMESQFDRIHNFHISVREVNGKIIFLRKLVAGGSEHSFGIHVAKLAGMPAKIIKRAEDVLRELEKDGKHVSPKTGRIGQATQLSFFQLDDPVLSQVRDEVKTLDINSLTPLEALNKLSDIQRIIRG